MLGGAVSQETHNHHLSTGDKIRRAIKIVLNRILRPNDVALSTKPQVAKDVTPDRSRKATTN